MQQTITTRQAAHLIRESGGRIFTADVLTKKLLRENPGVPERNITPRRFNGRTGVSKGVNGKGRSFTPGADLIQIAELPAATRDPKTGQFHGVEFDSDRYRFLWVPGIRRLAIRGQIYQVIPE
jgi:hypothetical protein